MTNYNHHSSSRRRALLALTALSSQLLIACKMNDSKKKIREFGKVFEYLKDPDLRTRETGDASLLVEGAEFSGESFQSMDWRNIVFRNCDFVGAYQIKPSSSTNLRYEDCRFSGIFAYGKSRDVHFVRCGWTNGSVAYAGEQSRNVTFESCRFVGTNPDPNHWGGVGSDGEAEFIDCTGRYFNLEGHAKVAMRRCEFEEVKCRPTAKESGGVFADVLIEDCKLRGDFGMVPADFRSLTIRDTTIEGTFDMTNATVKGDILMERVTGGVIKAGIKEGARSFTLRDSQINGDGQRVCNIYAGAFQHVLMENVVFGRAEGQPVGVGGGYEPDEKTPQPVLTQSLILKNVKAPSWRSARLNAATVRIERSEFLEGNFKEGRMDTLELVDVSVGSSIDFTDTQVREFKQSGTTDLKRLGRGLKLEGSNIKLPR